MATMNDGGDEQDAAPNCDERRSVYAAMRSGVFMFICSRSFNASGRYRKRERERERQRKIEMRSHSELRPAIQS